MKASELKALYSVMFSEYPDIVTVKQLQTMLGISRHGSYVLLAEGEIGGFKLGNANKILKINNGHGRRCGTFCNTGIGKQTLRPLYEANDTYAIFFGAKGNRDIVITQKNI